MDRAMIVEQLMDYCKRFVDNLLEAADLSTVAAASLAIVAQNRAPHHPLRDDCHPHPHLPLSRLWDLLLKCCSKLS
jgi:hypothetical protein